MNSSSFSGSPVASMAKPSTEESMTRAPKISASFRIAARLSIWRVDPDQDHLADHGAAVGEVGVLDHVDELVHLLDDQAAEARIDVDT